MVKMIITLAGLTTAVLLASASVVSAEEPPFTARQEERIGEIVRTYLLEHPEVLTEASRVLQARQAEEAAAQFAKGLQEIREDLLYNPASPVGGNPDGAVSVIEFFDYNCPYCRRASPIVAELLKINPNVRFVYKEWPILGKSSEFAAQAALAVHRQSPTLYLTLHDALMSAKEPLTEDKVVEIARHIGADVERMRSDMADPGIEAQIARNVELVSALGIRGTPAFVIGDELLRGVEPLAALQSAVEKALASEASTRTSKSPRS
jgi:protein-disulfide isomerase